MTKQCTYIVRRQVCSTESLVIDDLLIVAAALYLTRLTTVFCVPKGHSGVFSSQQHSKQHIRLNFETLFWNFSTKLEIILIFTYATFIKDYQTNSFFSTLMFVGKFQKSTQKATTNERRQGGYPSKCHKLTK